MSILSYPPPPSLSMKGYLAFPPPLPPPHTPTASTPAQPSTADIGACATWSHHDRGEAGQPEHGKNTVEEMMEGERRKRREQERALGEHSEIEWVRAGGVLRDASGRRDWVRTERIRQELRVRDVELERMARWEAYEARWRVLQSSTAPVAFVEFPWPLGTCMSSRDLNMLTRATVSEFLFESLAVRTNTTSRKDRIRVSLLRWHPDKISVVLGRVVLDDLELVREGIHIVFGILKALQDAERTGVL